MMIKALLNIAIGIVISIAIGVLNWFFGFLSGYGYGLRKGRRQMLAQRDKMEDLARKQYDRFEQEHERANAARGRAERAEFELKKKKKSKVTPLGPDEWPSIVGDNDDDDTPTIG